MAFAGVITVFLAALAQETVTVTQTIRVPVTSDVWVSTVTQHTVTVTHLATDYSYVPAHPDTVTSVIAVTATPESAIQWRQPPGRRCPGTGSSSGTLEGVAAGPPDTWHSWTVLAASPSRFGGLPAPVAGEYRWSTGRQSFQGFGGSVTKAAQPSGGAPGGQGFSTCLQQTDCAHRHADCAVGHLTPSRNQCFLSYGVTLTQFASRLSPCLYRSVQINFFAVVRTVIDTVSRVVTDYRTLLNTVFVHGGYY
ncbi:hypothetical protein GWK47_011211 [Chionoecetes opilio]|uniref:Uncharacterized protein n=1 Tax=Chionoecetes opilio TaxID=41210 RepID=A0A8J4Y2Z9_CHIOP|nr:hypothetical protein GWK47_011211 [Chionoecetes opilio]